jgi:hypothetical protein
MLVDSHSTSERTQTEDELSNQLIRQVACSQQRGFSSSHLEPGHPPYGRENTSTSKAN